MMLRKFCYLTFMLLLIVVSGCGGGASGTSASNQNTPTTATLTGVAATGSPVVGNVYLKDSSTPSKELVLPIAADGSYSFNVSGFTKPFLLKAVGTVNGVNTTLYSVSASPGTANINPFTNLAALSAAAGTDLATLYASLTPENMQQANTAFSQAMADLLSQMTPLLAAYQVQNISPVTGAYSANDQGLDALFDAITVTTANGQVTISNKATSAPVYVSQLSALGSGTLTTANVPGSTPASGSNPTLAALQSGLYEVMDTPFDTTIYSYSTERIGIDAAATALTRTYPASLNTTSKSWDDTTGNTVTPDPNDYIYEFAGGAWQVTNYRTTPFQIQVGSDGSLVLVNAVDGSRAKITVTSTDVSGQSLQSALGSSYIWNDLIAYGPLTNAGTANLPSGSLRYDIVWEQLSDNYLLLPGAIYGSSGVITSLSQIPTSLGSVYLDGDGANVSYFATFTSSTALNIYRQAQNSLPQLIGTGSYGPASGVTGETVTEITIPASLRTTYRLSDNPIFGVVNGTVLQGYHASAGTVSYTNSAAGYVNQTALAYIQSLFQSGAAKVVVVKGASRGTDLKSRRW